MARRKLGIHTAAVHRESPVPILCTRVLLGSMGVTMSSPPHTPPFAFGVKRDTKQKASEEAAPAEPARHRHTPGALEFSQIVGGAAFGRPALTEEEMDAVDSGGAECAPNVRKKNKNVCLVCTGVKKVDFDNLFEIYS